MNTYNIEDDLAVVERIKNTVMRLADDEIPVAVASCRSLTELEEACAAAAALVPAHPRTGQLMNARLWQAFNCGAKTAAYLLKQQQMVDRAFGRG